MIRDLLITLSLRLHILMLFLFWHVGHVRYRIGDWKWSDNSTAGIQLIDVVNNFNRTEAQSKEPRKLCCMVTHDTLLECTNCSEEHAFICEDFQGEK